MRITVALAAYNEGQNIGKLLAGIAQVTASSKLNIQVLVVNDGSKDNTAQVVQDASTRMDVTLIDQANQGFTRALTRALREAVSRSDADDVMITMDADNSHLPNLIPRLVEAIQSKDVIVASRYAKGGKMVGVPFHRELLSHGAKFLMRFFVSVPGIEDYSTAYRAYRASVLKQAFEVYGDDLFAGAGFSGIAGSLIRLKYLTKRFGEIAFVLRYDLKQGASSMNIGQTIQGYLGIFYGQLSGHFKPRKKVPVT